MARKCAIKIWQTKTTKRVINKAYIAVLLTYLQDSSDKSYVCGQN